MQLKVLTVLPAFCLVMGASAQPATAPARPKLVVGIMVDQMRWDFLYRYQQRYGNGGFNRLLNQGFTCENDSRTMR